MKVELLVSRAGVGFTQNCGDIIDVGDDEAQRLIDSNQAKAVGGRKAASGKPVIEAAVKKKPRARKRKSVNE